MRESEEGYAKEAWKSLTPKQKIRQFMDYYFTYVLIGAAAVIFLGSLIYTIFFHHEESILSVSVFNNMVDSEKRDDLESTFRDLIDDHEKDHSIIIKDGYSLDNYQDTMVFQVLVAGESTDILIAGEEVFAHYALSGFFHEPSVYLTEEELETYDDLIFETPGEPEKTDGQTLQDPEAKGEIRPYGIRLPETSVWNDYSLVDTEDAVIGVIANTKYPDNAAAFVRMMLGEE